MAGKQREPIELIKAKGKKHLTKKEIEDRKKQEIDVPFREIIPPSYLSAKQKKVFREYAEKLLHINIYTELDADCLARYIISQDLYVAYTESITQTIEEGNLVLLKELQSMQDKVFRQAQTSARDLGLTISSRCKLVVPKGDEKPKENKFNVFVTQRVAGADD